MTRVLAVAVSVQASLGAYRAFLFLSELPGIAPSLLARAGDPGAFSSALVAGSVVGIALIGGLAERGGAVPRLRAAGIWGLVALAAAGVALAAAGVLTTRLVPAAGWGALALVAAAAGWRLARRPANGTGWAGGRGRRDAPGPEAPRLSAWDLGTALLLAALVVPAAFPFVHYDAKEIWGCRALAIGASGSLTSMAGCAQPGYPPLFSLLLAFGGPDPVLSGRLSAWLLLACLALYLRGEFARLSPRLAAGATLWVVATGHVWVTSAMYYANVPLMAFLAPAALLTLGVPARRPGGEPSEPAPQAAAALLFAAAALLRPDGVFYAGVVAAAAAVAAARRSGAATWWPFGGAVAGWALWALRPTALRASGTFLDTSPTWRTAGDTAVQAALRVAGTFLEAWQGQWLSHYGLGLTIWGLALLAVAAWRRRRALSPSQEVYGLVTLGSLAAVAALYAALPFVVDVAGAVGPIDQPGFLPAFRNFVRVGMGRMSIHLLPLYVAFGLAVLQPPRPGAAGAGLPPGPEVPAAGRG